MPTLKQITCSLELGSSNTKLKEYGARYSDGAVETFVAIPETRLPFHIRLDTKGYIAPGLAAFVYMDGQYQCNRNRLRLVMPGDDVDPSQYEVEFVMRQKEEKTADGKFVGREWRFAQLDSTTADKAASLNPNFWKNFGTIEVVVLRCTSEREHLTERNTIFSRVEPSHSRKPSNTSARHSRTPSASASAKVKNATPAASGLGDMFGLFDGANDALENADSLRPIVSHDGTSDLMEMSVEKPAMPEGWQPLSIGNAEVSYNFHAPGFDDDYSAFGAPEGPHDDIPSFYGPDGAPRIMTINTIEADQIPGRPDSESQDDGDNGQLDGMAGRAYINQNQFAPGGINDMMGDKYFGMTGPPKRLYKQNLREAGYAVSETTAPARDYNVRPQQQQMPNQNQYPYNVPQYRHHQHKQQLPPAPPQQHAPDDFLVPGWQGSIYIDAQGSLMIGTQHIAAEEIPEALNALRRLRENTMQSKRDNLAQLKSLPHGHPDIDALTETQVELHNKTVQQGRIINGIGAALEAAQNAAAAARAVKVVREDDLTAQLRAKVDAQLGRQDQPAGTGNAGFQQVGEGAVGGGLSYNQTNWQQEQKPPSRAPSKAPSNAGGWGAPEQNSTGGGDGWGRAEQQRNDDSGNSWGGGQQDNAGGWAEAKVESRKSSHNRARSVTNKSNNWGGDQGKQSDSDGRWESKTAKGNGGNGGGWGSGTQNGDHDKSSGETGDGQAQATPRASSSQLVGYYATQTPQFKPKPYWSTWREVTAAHESSISNTKKKREEPRPVYQYPAPQLPAVPEGKTNGLDHVVQPGKGADYSHRRYRPKYLDEMSSPYAVFSFKYRSKTTLEKLLKRDVAADTDAVVAQAEKDQLMNMPRDRLVEELLKMRSPSGQKPATKSSSKQKDKPASQGRVDPDKAGSKAGSAAGGWRAVTEKAASAVGGWGGDANDNKAPSAAGGWGKGDSANNCGGGGAWDSVSRKSEPKKPALNAGVGGSDNKENTGNGGGATNNNATAGTAWDNTAAPVAGGGWDGGNDSKAHVQTPAAAQHVTSPTKTQDLLPPTTIKDFAYVQTQPETYNINITDHDVPPPSTATGFSRTERGHAFDGDPGFASGGGGPIMYGVGRGGSTGRGGVAGSGGRGGYGGRGCYGYGGGYGGDDGYLPPTANVPSETDSVSASQAAMMASLMARKNELHGDYSGQGGKQAETGAVADGYGGGAAADAPRDIAAEIVAAKAKLAQTQQLLQAMTSGMPGCESYGGPAAAPVEAEGGQTPNVAEGNLMKKWEDGNVPSGPAGW